MRVASDADLTSSGIQTSATWLLGQHSVGNYFQAMIMSEFTVYLAKDNSTPMFNILKGSSDGDVITYAGESEVSGIDGGAGFDVLYLSGATHPNFTTLAGGLKNVEQIWAINGATNTIVLNDAVLNTNASSLLINMDAGDSVLFNGTSYNFSPSAQTLYLGTAGNDQLQSTAFNDVMVGRGGQDTFKWLVSQTGTDTINDFSTTATNGLDKLDIASLLQGYASGSNLSNWVSVVEDSSKTTLSIDTDKTGSKVQTIVLNGVTGTGYTLQQWVDNNLLVVL